MKLPNTAPTYYTREEALAYFKDVGDETDTVDEMLCDGKPAFVHPETGEVIYKKGA